MCQDYYPDENPQHNPLQSHELKWTKFSDALPDYDKNIYVSNYKNVWIVEADDNSRSWFDWLNYYKLKYLDDDKTLRVIDQVWAYVPIPPVPTLQHITVTYEPVKPDTSNELDL